MYVVNNGAVTQCSRSFNRASRWIDTGSLFESRSWGILMNGRRFACAAYIYIYVYIPNGRFRAVKQKTDLFQHAPQSVSVDHFWLVLPLQISTLRNRHRSFVTDFILPESSCMILLSYILFHYFLLNNIFININN